MKLPLYGLGARLVRNGSLTDDELYLYLLTSITSLLALGMYLLLSVFFFIVGVRIMVWVNLAAVGGSAINFLLARRHLFAAAGLVLSLETITVTVCAMLLTGFYSFLIFYFLLILVLQFVIPYAHRFVRGSIAILLFVLLIIQVQIEGSYSAPFPLGSATVVYSSMNIIFTFVGISASVTSGNYVKNAIQIAREKHQSELESQVYTDPLTGLFNRRYAEHYFAELTDDRRGLGWCVAMLDIDDFKRINDTYGHAHGDIVLKELAKYLLRTLRKTDVIFRWGGEEILLLMASVECSVAYQVLEKIRLGLLDNEEMFAACGLSFTVTIGVAPLVPGDIEGSIEMADNKLYSGKNNGKNQVVA